MTIPDLLKQAFLKTADSIVGARTVTLDAEMDTPTRGLIVATAGNVAVIMANGNAVTLPALTAGVIHRVSVRKVITTGTTATGVIALY